MKLSGVGQWTRRSFSRALPATLLLGTVSTQVASAQGEVGPAIADPGGDKPFSEHKLALQLSDEAPLKQHLVISVAYNLLGIYGPDAITMEVVVFADGMGLLAANSVDRPQVDSLISQGVVFSACGNTLAKIKRTTGHPFPLNPKAVEVNAGVARLLALSEKGFTIIRP